MGGLFAVAKRWGSFPVRRGGGVMGFALGAVEVGRAFQRAAGEVGRGSQRRGCCRRDDAPGDSGGTIAGRTTLQVTMGVPIARGRGKENELLGPTGTGRFVRFVGRTAGSNGSIPVRLLPGAIGRTGQEP